MPKVPKKVAENAFRALELRKTFKYGGTEVGIAMAKRIVKAYEENRGLTFKHVKKISEYFPMHANDNLSYTLPPSKGLIAWLLWGGDEGWKWSKAEVEKVKGN